MSCAYRRWSKPMEALISSMIASGPVWNRPPHILLLMFDFFSARMAMTERPEDATPPEKSGSARPGRFALVVAAAVILGAIAGLQAYTGIGGGTRNAVATLPPSAAGDAAATAPAAGADATCTAAADTAKRIAGLAKGELAAFAPTQKPTRLPDLAFLDPEGKPVKLSEVGGDGLKLVNIWATWCVPCREEMPALDGLQAELGAKDGGKPGFEVVAINMDTRDPAKPRRSWTRPGSRTSRSTPIRRARPSRNCARSVAAWPADDDADRRQGLRDRPHRRPGRMGEPRRACSAARGAGGRRAE